MAARESEAPGFLDDVSRFRARTRHDRSGHWFASVVFGIVVLGALPFYVRSTPPVGAHCRRVAVLDGASSCVGVVSRLASSPLLGRAFEAQPFSSLGAWSTLYWAIAIVVGFALVVAYYHLRARKVGVQGRLWPAVASGLVILGLVMWANDSSSLDPLDFWFRGTSVLVVIALTLLVLSVLERSRAFSVFAAGFLGLALLSCLYNVVNLFHRLGIGGPFGGGSSTLPNLVLPGAYLVVGGLVFLLWRGSRLDVRVHLVRTVP